MKSPLSWARRTLSAEDLVGSNLFLFLAAGHASGASLSGLKLKLVLDKHCKNIYVEIGSVLMHNNVLPHNVLYCCFNIYDVHCDQCN